MDSLYEIAEERARKLAFSRPWGILYRSEIEALVADLDFGGDDLLKQNVVEAAARYLNRILVIKDVSEFTDKTPDGAWAVHRFKGFRCTSMVYLVHRALWNKPWVSVKLERTQKGTAMKVLPNGDRFVVELDGSRMSLGRWGWEYRKWPELDETEIRKAGGEILFACDNVSRGGGLAGRTYVVGLPTGLERPVLLGTVTEGVEGRGDVTVYYIYSNGVKSLVPLEELT